MPEEEKVPRKGGTPRSPEELPPASPRSEEPEGAAETPAVDSTQAPVEPPVAPAPAPPVEPWESQFRYLFADFENFRRRAERERGQSLREGRARILQQLLPIFEASQRAREAVQHLPARDPIRQGIELLIREWEKFLRTEHVESVARTGTPFQSATMEAVAEAPATSAYPSGSVVEIVQQGYVLGEELLRPAKVVVARVPARPPRTPEAEPTASGPSEGPSVG
ncbi:MAG: nucleotide exchange factor GrpE [Thermoplasmata archaeon]|nr:nucleotide exchange factor GrpE [Thermoplasmata archaeon]